MAYYVGLDVSLELSSVCVVDAAGKIVREGKVRSEPETLVAFLAGLGLAVTRVGLEAGPLSQWLHAGLTAAGYETVLLETRHVKAALSAMVVKTDRRDARGIAQLLRMGWYRPVHSKSPAAQEARALLAGRKMLLGKLLDLELSIRGILRGFGLKLGETTRARFAGRARELAAGQAMLEAVVEPMLRARDALRTEAAALHRRLLAVVREHEVCRRLMTVPGVGAVVALTFVAAVDDPARFRRSKDVGAHFGLTPKRHQSGETEVVGGITRVGDASVRVALYEAANVLLTRVGPFSTLKRWAMEVAKRRGARRAKVALARKLAVVLHRVGGTASDGWTAPSSAGARSRQRPRPDPVGRRAKEGDKIGVGQTGARSPEVPSPGRGNGEAAERGVALPTGGDHAVPRSARRSPLTRMVWRPWRRPRTEARTWRRDGHSRD